MEEKNTIHPAISLLVLLDILSIFVVVILFAGEHTPSDLPAYIAIFAACVIPTLILQWKTKLKTGQPLKRFEKYFTAISMTAILIVWLLSLTVSAFFIIGMLAPSSSIFIE